MAKGGVEHLAQALDQRLLRSCLTQHRMSGGWPRTSASTA